MASKIFISYRRDDAKADARGLRDGLARTFGAANVFMDVDNLLIGQRFDQELEKALDQCDVFLAVIGPRWTDLLAARQEQNERDYVSEEIAAALKRGAIVIPVLVDEASMPPQAALPEDLRDLALYQAHNVTHARFGRDVEELIAGIKASRKAHGTGNTGSGLRWVAASLVILSLLGGGGYVWWQASEQTRIANEKADAVRRKTAARAAEAAEEERQEAEREAKEAAAAAEAERKARDEEPTTTNAVVAEFAEDLFRDPGSPFIGNLNSDITIVEFFDYNCGYCRRGFADVTKLINTDSNLRIVFKEFPILSKDSELASRVALAAHEQGKYWELHRELISTRGTVDQSIALKAAKRLGLNMAKLRSDMNSPKIKDEIERVKKLANNLGILGTPHFFVGDRSVPGAPDNLFDLLSRHVADLRRTGCSYC